MGDIIYGRKLTAKEVNDGFLYITREGLKNLPPVSKPFTLQISDREFKVKIDAKQTKGENPRKWHKIDLKEINEFSGFKKGADIVFVKEKGGDNIYLIYTVAKLT